jgi:hypothetical protein
MFEKLSMSAICGRDALPAEFDLALGNACPDFAVLAAPALLTTWTKGYLLHGVEAFCEIREAEVFRTPFLQAIIGEHLTVSAGQLPEGSISDDAAPAPGPATTDLVLHIIEGVQM